MKPTHRYHLYSDRQLLFLILKHQEDMMGSFQELKDELAEVTAEVAELRDDIQADRDLDNQVVADLQARVDAADALVASLQAHIAELEAAGEAVSGNLTDALNSAIEISTGVKAAIKDIAGPHS